MKYLVQLIIALVCVLQADSALGHTGVINVRDYGATGNGTDQTLAIQMALNDAHAALKVFSNTSTGGGTEAGTCPAVYFPSGDYRISTPLVLPNKYIQIKGDGASLKPTSSFPATGAAIKYSTPYRNAVSGMIFIGFPHAIELGSVNWDVDQGTVTISECQFVGITDTAIRYGFLSSILVIENSRFDYCRRVVRIWNCDSVIFRDCWVSQKGFTQDRDSAFFIEGGTFTAQNSFFITAGTTPSQECAWFTVTATQFNTHNSLTLDNCRLSKENGGMTLVNWKISGDKTYPVVPNGLTITKCSVEGGQGNVAGQKQCLVRLFESPNFIAIKNNSGLVDATTMQWASGVDGTAKVWTDQVNAPLTVDVSGNCGSGNTNLGLNLNYVLPEFSGKANLR